jgi:hypothetical protein
MMHHRIFGILFLLTGLFAILGGLYTWGDGSIFNQSELIKVLIPWADIIFTGPLSMIAGIGLLKQHAWAVKTCVFLSGGYVFGLYWFLSACFGTETFQYCY